MRHESSKVVGNVVGVKWRARTDTNTRIARMLFDLLDFQDYKTSLRSSISIKIFHSFSSAKLCKKNDGDTIW